MHDRWRTPIDRPAARRALPYCPPTLEEGPLKFLITFNHIDGEWDKLTPDEQASHGAQLGDLMRALREEQGTQLVFLAPKEDAKTVRIRTDKRLEVVDGPPSDSPEQLGGYYVVEADSMQEAVEWARRGRFLVGSNEVREIVEFPG
ncbi:MAG: YciI family protein [Chloroflexi bacterium]|nr:YciI family protein [Chloroflexota bacterium]